MDRERARDTIKSRIECERYLTPSKSGMYNCPFCGSGNGPNGTGALKVYKNTNTWTCHACNKSGDVIDLYMNETGADYNTALSLMADELGITIDRYQPPTTTAAAAFKEKPLQEGQTAPQSDFKTEKELKPAEDVKAAENGNDAPADYTEYYQECRRRLKAPEAVEYLNGRGISLETAAAYWIGYDPAADPAQAPGAIDESIYKPHPCPRIIIPTSKTHYVGRSTDPETPKPFQKMNPKGGSPGIFNDRALYTQDVQEIFVCEGAFDALSILEAGYTAIALNSAGNHKALLKQLEQRRTDATLVLCPDNDADPQTAERVKKEFKTLSDGLRRLNVAFINADICGGYKDANEHLTGNRAAFIETLEQAQRQAGAKPDNTAYYLKNLMAGEISKFKTEKLTGFKNLDEGPAGGLNTGLYVLGAISSLGKTTFALQLADQLAAGGHDVIFFSMEQSRLELVSKSLARRTVTKDEDGILTFENAVSSLSIRKGHFPESVVKAMAEYSEAVSDRLSIVEGNFNCNISFIGDYIRRYIQRNDTWPIVFIDYLQIIQPAEDVRRISTKEVIDNVVTELKRMSRELDLTLIVISSVNRQNYLTPFDFDSLKESGGIEFTADVVWGLQLAVIHDEIFEKEKHLKDKREKVKKAKGETPRKIELVCLKNRYGISNYSAFFNYYPANDLFTEDTGVEFNDGWTWTPKDGNKK